VSPWSPLASHLLLWPLLILVVAGGFWLDRRLARRPDPDDVVFYLDTRTVDRIKREARSRREADLRASTDLTAMEGARDA
jgi:hypothetical protein